MPNFNLRREGKYWYIVYAEGSRSKHYSTGELEKSDAKEVLKAFEREYYTPDNADLADAPVDTLLRRYQDEVGCDAMSADTATRTFDLLCDYYTDTTAAGITSASNKKFERDMRKRYGWANSTINRHRNTLRAALKHAVRDGKLKYAPFVPTLKVVGQKERWLLVEEAIRLYRACLGKRLRYMNLFVRLGLATGARHEALLSLTWDRVDFETGYIDFNVPGRVITKKRRPNAPTDDRTMKLLKAAFRVRTGEYVIMHRGGPLKSVKKAFGEACKRAKISGVTAHTMKHTYITWLLRAGVAPWHVSGLTATSVATILRVYGHHVKDDTLKLAANTLKPPSARIVPEPKE
jgi:integrase